MGGVWRAIRHRDDIQVGVADLPDGVDGVSVPTAWGWAVLLSKHLTRAERRAVLAHEWHHIEHGGGAAWAGMPATWRAVVARDELRADRAAARRLIDINALEALRASGEPLTVAEVAHALDVPAWLITADGTRTYCSDPDPQRAYDPALSPQSRNGPEDGDPG